jgi:hypothetical protein
MAAGTLAIDAITSNARPSSGEHPSAAESRAEANSENTVQPRRFTIYAVHASIAKAPEVSPKSRVADIRGARTVPATAPTANGTV